MRSSRRLQESGPGVKSPAKATCCGANLPAQSSEDRLASPIPTSPVQLLSSRSEWIELLVPCTLDIADHIQNFLAWAFCDLPEEIRESVGSTLHELLLNAMEWGGKLDSAKQVRVAFLRGQRMLLFRISDPGTGFRLKDLTHAALNNAPDKPCEHLQVREKQGLRPGGFGLLLARAAADELIYNEARNEVLFVKYLA
jgi:anti-sigma regulatory factor (Ser/Thr protein kinase)